MKFKLYEVVRYGSENDPNGPDGVDTIFLVQANSLQEASDLIDSNLPAKPDSELHSYADVIHEIGEDGGSRDPSRHDAQIVRGPYYQHAFSPGWPVWHRDSRIDTWYQMDGKGNRISE